MIAYAFAMVFALREAPMDRHLRKTAHVVVRMAPDKTCRDFMAEVGQKVAPPGHNLHAWSCIPLISKVDA